MGRKKQIFLQLYTKDYTGDERLRMCSPAAWGVYSYLLCLMNSQPVRGAYQLSLLEQRPDLKRSKTRRVLSATTESAKVPPFAEILQRQMPWKKTEILRALRELIFYRVIVIEDDALIQPRMYREGGHTLKSDAQQEEADKDETSAADSGSDAADNTENKVSDNDSFSYPENKEKKSVPAHAIARTRSENMSYENINNKNNKEGNNSNINAAKSKKEKTPGFIPPTLEEVKAYFLERGTTIDPEAFWAHYEANGWIQSRGKPIRNWKACLTTWEHRRNEFGDGRGKQARSPRIQNDTVQRPQENGFDDMESFG